jgi:hypothetical protein
MAIPCGACEQPVHDHAVICPHCGKPSGIAPDPTRSHAEIGALLATDPLAEAPAIYTAPTPDLTLLVGAAAVVGAAVATVVDALRDAQAKPKLPTAVAHVRRRHVTPVPSAEPEHVERPGEGEEPRFLK